MSKRGPKETTGRKKWDKSPSLVALPPGDYSPPSWLVNPHALRQFGILSNQLAAANIAGVDPETLALACAAFGRAVNCEILLEEEGDTIKDNKGSKKKNPAAQIGKDNRKAYLDFYKEFGLAKAKIAKEKPEKPTGTEAYCD
jgi:P27 family predicted phage terminase small subunit